MPDDQHTALREDFNKVSVDILLTDAETGLTFISIAERQSILKRKNATQETHARLTTGLRVSAENLFSPMPKGEFGHKDAFAQGPLKGPRPNVLVGLFRIHDGRQSQAVTAVGCKLTARRVHACPTGFSLDPVRQRVKRFHGDVEANRYVSVACITRHVIPATYRETKWSKQPRIR